jgi:Rps23 Pro-64 3,4-dihydroxylase Tpa1-like proline 4-hydroxylase
MLNLEKINTTVLQTEPYKWGFINELFTSQDASDLAATYPCDKFKRVTGHDGEKGYEYFSRSLIHMGASQPSHEEGLSPAWARLAHQLLSPAYREAMSRLTGLDLSAAPLEVNVIHYGPNCWLGPHVDLKEKILTQVLYFNETWRRDHGGYLNILNSSEATAVAGEILPLVGNSAVLVRSRDSWHSVARVAEGCTSSRRSVNVIFHSPGAVSTMWPAGENPKLSPYKMGAEASTLTRLLGKLKLRAGL